MNVKALCGCGKQVAFIRNSDESHSPQIESLTRQGYKVMMSESLEPSQFAVEPCYENPDCCFKSVYTNRAGIAPVSTKPRNCGAIFGAAIHQGRTWDSAAEDGEADSPTEGSIEW